MSKRIRWCSECGMAERVVSGNGCRHCQAMARVQELTKKLTRARTDLEGARGAHEQTLNIANEAEGRAETLGERVEQLQALLAEKWQPRT